MSESCTDPCRTGDCLNPDTGLKTLADRSVDHVITDPPFEEEAHTLQRRIKPTGWRKGAGEGRATVVTAPLKFDAISEPDRLVAAGHFARIARRWIIVFCQIEAVHLWRSALEAGGACYKRTGIWRKPDGMPQLNGDRPGMGYETFVIAHAPGRSRWNGGGKHAVWTSSKGDRHTDHQTEKPLALMTALVEDFTDRGDLICDPFAGSGTTGVAALSRGRRFIGWEIDPRYAATARARCEATRDQLSLFSEAR